MLIKTSFSLSAVFQEDLLYQLLCEASLILVTLKDIYM